MKPPTPEEIERVEGYKQWLREINCRHEELTFYPGDSQPVCSDCGLIVLYLTQPQIDYKIELAFEEANKDVKEGP